MTQTSVKTNVLSARQVLIVLARCWHTLGILLERQRSTVRGSCWPRRSRRASWKRTSSTESKWRRPGSSRRSSREKWNQSPRIRSSTRRVHQDFAESVHRQSCWCDCCDTGNCHPDANDAKSWRRKPDKWVWVWTSYTVKVPTDGWWKDTRYGSPGRGWSSRWMNILAAKRSK